MMKKLYTFLILAFGVAVGNAQIVAIPDINLKNKLLAATSGTASTQPVVYNSSTGTYTVASYNIIDTNNDGEIQVSEASQITYLKLTNCSLSDLTGIESFVNLQYLRCDTNALTGSLSFPQLTALKYLDCSENHLTNLSVSQNTILQYLDCSWNDLPNIDVSSNLALNYFDSYHNGLTTFNVSQNTALKTLSCGGMNQLTDLDVSQNTLLENLYCTNYELTNLDVTHNPALKILNCNYNQIGSLDLSHNLLLTKLYCDYNQLDNLDLSQNTALEYLTCTNNQMSILSLLHNPVLLELNCNFNDLTTLNVENTGLRILNCQYNDLISLFLKNGNPSWTTLGFAGNTSLAYICADEEDVISVRSRCTSLGYVNCNVNSYCSFVPGGTYYRVEGNTRHDFDNNGCDITDWNVPNQKFTISNGSSNSSVVANQSGFYAIPLSAGNNIITPIMENPAYFTISPPTVSVAFPTATSPFTQNFCVSANGIHNDLEVAIIPITATNSGFDASYKIIFVNKGTTLQAGSVNLTFDDSILDFVTAIPNTSSQSANSLSWNFNNLQPFETREIRVTLNVNSPTETPPVNSGDVLHYTATINGTTDETPIDNTAILNQLATNSMDPNDKTCVEGPTVSIAMIGQYLHYVIRFENTGTANAQNIVVKDVLDTSKFDISTLVPLHGSHPFETRISSGNKAEFIFENINLPFDDAHNDGYVTFKIKTLPTIQVGQTVTNSANIYFDYNAPVVTNTYSTTVTALGIQDFDFGSLFSLSPVPSKDVLNITVKQNVIMSSVSIYNTLGQLVQVSTHPIEAIDVSGLQTGTYFIKIISDKGTATSKFLKE